MPPLKGHVFIRSEDERRATTSAALNRSFLFFDLSRLDSVSSLFAAQAIKSFVSYHQPESVLPLRREVGNALPLGPDQPAFTPSTGAKSSSIDGFFLGLNEKKSKNS